MVIPSEVSTESAYCGCKRRKMILPAGMLQVYDLLVACGWMAGSHTSAPSASAQRVDGQPPPGSIVKCDSVDIQMHPLFSRNLQAFPGFHPGPSPT